MKKLLIFIPAYNSEKTIVSVLDRFPRALWDRTSEVLILDNGSEDSTFKKVIDYKKRNNLRKLVVMKNHRNLGYGGSKKRAFKYGIDKGYDIFLMIHSDGQYPPENALDMIRPIEQEKMKLVIGSRIDPIKGGMKIWKLLGNRTLTYIENMVFGLRLYEFHSGYKAYDLKSLGKIPIGSFDNDHVISSETIAAFKARNFPITEVLVPTHYSKNSSECSFSTSVRYGMDVMKLINRYILYKFGINRRDKLFSSKNNLKL